MTRTARKFLVYDLGKNHPLAFVFHLRNEVDGELDIGGVNIAHYTGVSVYNLEEQPSPLRSFPSFLIFILSMSCPLKEKMRLTAMDHSLFTR